MLQAIRTLWVPRVTLKAVAELSPVIQLPDAHHEMKPSNVYSQGESLLLQLLTMHVNAVVTSRASRGKTARLNYTSGLNSLSPEVKNGLAIAYLITSCCPKLEFTLLDDPDIVEVDPPSVPLPPTSSATPLHTYLHICNLHACADVGICACLSNGSTYARVG